MGKWVPLAFQVVRSDNLMQVNYRHNGPLKDVDLALLYNGQEETGGTTHHYSEMMGNFWRVLNYLFQMIIMMRILTGWKGS